MLLLVHGGLWEDIDAERFWTRTGVAGALSLRSLDVRLVDRLPRAASWPDDAEFVFGQFPQRPVSVLAGSNGCSVALRLAIDHRTAVERLVLAWPATAGDPAVDAATAARLVAAGADRSVVSTLLGGDTVRGVADAELARLAIPVAIVPAVPADRAHQRRTVDALRDAVPHAVELSGTPTPFHRRFAQHLPRLAAEVGAFVVPP
jgi:pimeloyl-ACP methyl ester carboxylesterase